MRRIWLALTERHAALAPPAFLAILCLSIVAQDRILALGAFDRISIGDKDDDRVGA